MIIASIPTAIIGILFEDLFEGFYTTLLPDRCRTAYSRASYSWISEREEEEQHYRIDMTWKQALAPDLCRALLFPGISRSGSTLFGGLESGLQRDFAVKFAFLISIPSILGSLIFEGGSDAMDSAVGTSMGPVIAGCIAAALSGVLAIKTMIAVVRKLSLRYFSIYVWIVGVCLIAYTLIKK